MLTPSFKLTQDENHVFITVHAPYTNIGNTEIDVDGDNFLFVSSPYFLRLRLPGRIVENDHSKGSYTCDSGDFNLTFDKEIPGEHFENLDMITSLLAPRDIPDVNPNLVEVLEKDGINIESEDDDNDDSVPTTNSNYPYGFANKISTDFCDIASEFPQIFELKTPEQVDFDDRHVLRKKHEADKFSSDHYFADLFDEELLEPYQTATVAWNSPHFDKDADFTEEEVALLKELPNKHYLLTKTQHRQVLLGLIDILYGYCYDKRTTMNESNVESSWTINKLSATFSWFCTFNDLKQVLVTCYRRALIYPLFRNYDLCKKVKDDLVSLFQKGKKFIIKCLIDIHQTFNSNDSARYILNQLYIKDYLVFLQKCSSDDISELCNNMANIDIFKKDLELDLEELEEAAEMVQKEELEIVENEMAVKMASLSLMPGLKRVPLEDELSDSYFYFPDSSSEDSSSSSDGLDSDDDLPICQNKPAWAL